MRMRHLAVVTASLNSIALLSGRTGEPETTDPSTHAATSAASTPSPAPPELKDFSAEAAEMSDWGDTCAAVNLRPLLDKFADADDIDMNSDSPASDSNTDESWSGSCKANIDVPGSRAFNDVYLSIQAFDTNVQAFDYYNSYSITTAELFSDAPIDDETWLPEQSPWNDARITAQETPTVKSEQRSVAAAALLGDYYTVELLVRFEPGNLTYGGCESEAPDECVMTAAYLAGFLSESGFLDDLHADIESASHHIGG